MQVDVNKPLRALKIGRPDKDFDGKLKNQKGEDVTLGEVCIAALVSIGPRCPRCGTIQFPADTQDGKEKFDRWMLAQRLEKAKKKIELTVDEIKMLKDAVAKSETIVVAGQVWEILDPALAKKGTEKEESDAGE